MGEVEQILAQANVSDPMGLRDRAILETFYSTGVRRMEMANLLMYDLDVDRGTLMVRQGKGKKDRVVPIGDRGLAWIDRYIHDVRPGLTIGDRSENHEFKQFNTSPFLYELIVAKNAIVTEVWSANRVSPIQEFYSADDVVEGVLRYVP